MNVIIQPDYVEGTQVTSKQLDKWFPFGYAVIYLNEEGEKQIHEIHNKLFDWKWDWNQVKIEPDISANRVTWTLPTDFSATGSRGSLTNAGSTFRGETRFTNEIVRARAFYFKNAPTPYVGILNDDERRPVFVIGFRIQKDPNESFIPP